MLNFALAMTHDGTVGHWSGAKRYDLGPLGTDDDGNLDYLLGESRAWVLDCELGESFSTRGQNGSATVFQTRPNAPDTETPLPALPLVRLDRPDPGVFASQLRWLRNYADLRADRINEIHIQMSDLLSFFGAVGFLNGSRRKYTLELLYTMLRQVVRVGYRTKHYCRAPRPIDLSDQVNPIIQTPDHSAFPAGHATESFAIAAVLDILMNKRSDPSNFDLGFVSKDPGNGTPVSDFPGFPMHYRVAARITVNRTVAGVHFPVDNMSGAVLGCRLAQAFHALAKGKVLVPSAEVAAVPLPDEDFRLRDLDKTLQDMSGNTDLADDGTLTAPAFAWLWAQAEKEWEDVTPPVVETD